MAAAITPSAPTGAGASVQLREDAPLAGRGRRGVACGPGPGCAGPRALAASFAVLSAAVTLALLAQLYAGDYETAGHGSVSSSAVGCSQVGARALRAGGRALDAAAAAALCLAAARPQDVTLDASGALVYWESRASGVPRGVRWAGAGTGGPGLARALAALHAQLGVLPWSDVLRPALATAREAAVEDATGDAVRLAARLEALQRNRTEACGLAGCGAVSLSADVSEVRAGGWRLWAVGPGAARALSALATALHPAPPSVDTAMARAAAALSADSAASGAMNSSTSGSGGRVTGVSGLAVVDARDAYLALVTVVDEAATSGATSMGSGALGAAAAVLAEPGACGSRFVVGAESAWALAQGGAALAHKGLPGVELVRAGPGAANVVQQRAGGLQAHSDGRAGGFAARF